MRGNMGAREGSSRKACRYLQVGDPVLDQIREIFRLFHSPVAHAVRLAEVVEVCHDGPADTDVTLSHDAFNTPGYLAHRHERVMSTTGGRVAPNETFKLNCAVKMRLSSNLYLNP